MFLPVRRLVLYKHGVGFIERAKSFTGTQPLKLRFKRDVMDDILKSLSVIDEGDGRVTGVSYETADDVAELLADKAIRLPEREALIGLLRQLRGYFVKVQAPEGAVEGTVLGTEEQQQISTKLDISQAHNQLVLRQQDGTVRALRVDQLSGIELLDAEASDDLNFFLEAVTAERRKNVKAVTVFLDGSKHDLAVSYIQPMPSWRVSYRLAHDDDRTVLQAWGIIDNKLDEDLKDVRLSLVAGKPISFIYEIYTPRIVNRPVVREEVRTVSAPVELESGMEELDDMELSAADAMDYDMEEGLYEQSAPAKKMKAMASGYGGANRSRRQEPAPPPAPSPTAGAIAQSAAVHTKSVEMGEFFKYDIEAPVTVKRGQSAMVPIVQTEITCAKEHVYNASKMPRNPVVTMRVTNDTGAVLERGPILVLDEGTYVGEAVLPYTTVGRDSHIAYSVDLGVVVTEEHRSGSNLTKVGVANRYLQQEFLEWRERDYKVENRKKEAVDLVIEHRKSDHILDEDKTEKPTEETETYYRWKFKVKPKSSSTFTVREVVTRYYSESIRYLGHETVKSYYDQELISKRDFKGVKEIIDLQLKINKHTNALSKLDNEKDRIVNEQSRLRDNIESLGDSPREEKLRVRYVDKLDDQENRLEAILKERHDHKVRIQKLERAIEKALSSWD